MVKENANDKMKKWMDGISKMEINKEEKSFKDYTETLNETRRNRDEVKKKLKVALKEIKLRKQYERFLKSVIKSGEDLDDKHTFEWFSEWFERQLK